MVGTPLRDLPFADALAEGAAGGFDESEIAMCGYSSQCLVERSI
jgi:hypothetical protein